MVKTIIHRGNSFPRFRAKGRPALEGRDQVAGKTNGKYEFPHGGTWSPTHYNILIKKRSSTSALATAGWGKILRPPAEYAVSGLRYL